MMNEISTIGWRFLLASALLFALSLTVPPVAADGGIDPYPGAPECPTHNPHQWHPHWDRARGCYYDHEHKDNPGVILPHMTPEERDTAQAVLDLFGPPGQWFGGSSISYPWQTFHGAGPSYVPGPNDPNLYENAAKHEGYGWIVRTDLPARGGHYIRDYRLQYHAIFAGPGATTRYHSYSLEANICKVDEGCRIIRTGGWIDFGHLRISGKRVPLPDQDGDGQRQRLHANYRFGAREYARNDNFRTAAVWYGSFAHPDHVRSPWKHDDVGKPFRRLAIAIETYDAWAEVNIADPTQQTFFCPAFDCNKNGSTIKMHRMTVDIVEPRFNGYTDRFGLPTTACSTPALDCIPTTIEPGTRFYASTSDTHVMPDYDMSPEGVWWLRYPN